MVRWTVDAMTPPRPAALAIRLSVAFIVMWMRILIPSNRCKWESGSV